MSEPTLIWLSAAITLVAVNVAILNAMIILGIIR